MGMLPTVVATLLADTREYMAKMDEAGAKMAEFGGIAEASGGRMNKFANTASTAVLGIGAAMGAYAVDKAYTFQESLDKLQNQAGLTADQADKLGNAILGISTKTGVSTTDLTNAALTVEQAGIRGAKAIDVMTAAAQAAVVTNASVADTTKAIVAAQSLQIAKGMSVNDLTGKLVAGSREFVGGLQAEESMLSGRVGVALANYGLNLSTVTALGAEFAKVGLPTKSISAFAGGFASLEQPTTSYIKKLNEADLSQNILAADLRKGNIGGMLAYIKDQAGGSAAKLSEMVNAVFGKSGGGAASDLIKNLQSFITIQQKVAGAGKGSLQSGFSEAVKQLGPQFKIVMAQVDALFIEAGKYLLPKVADVLKWANELIGYFKAHPLVAKIASDTAIALFAASIGVKLWAVLSSVLAKFGVGVAAEEAGTVAATSTTGAGVALGAEGAAAAAGGTSLGAAVGIVAAPFVAEYLLLSLTKGNHSAGYERAMAMYDRGLGGSQGIYGYKPGLGVTPVAPKKTTHKVTVTVRGHGTIGK